MRGHLTTWFQPIVDTMSGDTMSRDTMSGHVLAHECLIRMSGEGISGIHNDPAAFTGAFDACTRSLAIRAAAQQSRFGTYFVGFTPPPLCDAEAALDALLRQVSSAWLQPRNIVLQIAEPELLRNSGQLRHVCELYRARGFRIALTEIGSPQTDGTAADAPANDINGSPFASLRPDFVSPAKHLTQKPEPPRHAACIHRLVELADRFGATMIAQSVEKAHAMEHLWLLGVRYMQGPLFGRAQPRIANSGRDLVNLLAALEAGGAAVESCGATASPGVPAGGSGQLDAPPLLADMYQHFG